MESTDSFDGHHQSVRQDSCRSLDGVVAPDRFPSIIEQEDARAALGTRIRLRVETPVGRIVVLTLAVGTHEELAHGGVRAVVGDVLYDAVTRAAVGAVYEGIAVASVRRIEKLTEAIAADARIRLDEGCPLRRTFAG